MAGSANSEDVPFTVFIKVPFPRGEFEDPPACKWNASKDGELWKALSSTSKGTEINWENLARQFDVTLHFLLQQAAWLYERQLSQVREQLRRVGKPPIGASPTPTASSGSAGATTSTGGYAMRRGGSSNSRVPSSLSVRPKRSSESRNDASVPTSPVQGRIPYSRTTSKDTIMAVPRTTAGTHSSAREHLKSQRPSIDDGMAPGVAKRPVSIGLTSPSGALSESSGSSGDQGVGKPRAFSRRPQFSPPKGKNKGPMRMLSSTEEDEEDDDDAPAFLPLSSNKQDRKKSAPFRDMDVVAGRKHSPAILAADKSEQGPSTSSSQSLSSPAQPLSSVPSISSQGPHIVRTTAVAALSPRQRRKAQDGSEGTPSMGSSFSDLDDASVTQSALEETLAREMKAGKGSLGVVTRMGGLWKGQAGSSRRAANE